MKINIDPKRLQQAVKAGFDRVKIYRSARAMFIKEFCGQYFKNRHGLTGDTPINLLFSTVRAYVPNLVMKTGINKVTTEIMSHKFTAELLGYGLDALHKDIKLKDKLRAWIVDAIFGIGIMETALGISNNLIAINDIDKDPGEIYSQIIDLDDFTFDPACTDLKQAFFLGHIVRCPRAELHAIEDLNTELINQLPKALLEGKKRDEKQVENISQDTTKQLDMQDIEDYVEVVKLWIPSANAIVYMPDPRRTTFDKFIGVKEFYGPSTGPYNFLALTPPVPNNPLPVAPVGIWYDLHNMTNRVFKKLMDQVDNQKDLIFYMPELGDVMQDVIEAGNLDTIACSNPDGIKMQSFGGQNEQNVAMADRLQSWYNYIAGNPEQIAGIQQTSKTATQAQIMQANSSITLNDMRDIIYDRTAELSQIHCWYLWTDPLIKMPKTKRESGDKEVQLWLTPEQMQGDFIEYTFKIRQRSMSRLDPQTRTNLIVQYAVKIVPSAVMAAQQMAMMGQQFNLQKYLTIIAEETDIGDIMMDVFNDPEFQQKMEMMVQLGPQDTGKASMMSPGGVIQQGGSPIMKSAPTPGQEFNQNVQAGANEGQQARTSGGF